MATKKPVRYSPPAKPASPTLMGNQDLAHKGDSTTKNGKVCMTFWVTPEHRAEIKAYAAEHDTTASRLIVEGLKMRMGKE